LTCKNWLEISSWPARTDLRSVLDLQELAWDQFLTCKNWIEISYWHMQELSWDQFLTCKNWLEISSWLARTDLMSHKVSAPT
jgi:hypothetical protein